MNIYKILQNIPFKRLKSLGTEYTKERIKKRIEEKVLAKDKKRVPFPAGKKPLVKDYSKKNLIDTTGDKFAESPGLKHWADIQNLKIAAASYTQAGSIAELEQQIAAKLAKTARDSLVETEHQLKDLGQVLKYAEQYKANHIYRVRYQKSKDTKTLTCAAMKRSLSSMTVQKICSNASASIRKMLMLKSSATITMHSTPKSRLYRKPISLLRKKPLTLTEN